MAEDARFEDGGDKPLRLIGADAADLQVISTLTQDAVFPITEMKWLRSQRRFAILLNRFRWEDKVTAVQRSRPFERAQAMLVIDDVVAVASQGIDRTDTDTILSLLAMDWEGDENGGRIVLTLSGDGLIGVDVEAINVTLKDVTRPYEAPSKRAPEHPE